MRVVFPPLATIGNVHLTLPSAYTANVPRYFNARFNWDWDVDVSMSDDSIDHTVMTPLAASGTCSRSRIIHLHCGRCPPSSAHTKRLLDLYWPPLSEVTVSAWLAVWSGKKTAKRGRFQWITTDFSRWHNRWKIFRYLLIVSTMSWVKTAARCVWLIRLPSVAWQNRRGIWCSKLSFQSIKSTNFQVIPNRHGRTTVYCNTSFRDIELM